MKKLAYERFIWFHKQVKEGAYPNASALAVNFELSRKTAQRDIEFFRDRLNAPLDYCSSRRGYFYTDSAFELTSFWLDRSEIAALLLAKRLASSIPDRSLKNLLRNFFKKLSPFISKDPLFDWERIDEKISVKNIEYFNVDNRLFHDVIDALFKEKPLRIVYYSPHRHEETRRAIIPLHLLHYMGNWHLISWCSLKGELRNFALSRIRSLEPSGEPLLLPANLPPMKDYLRKQFGIFSGDGGMTVSLRFSHHVSRWVKEQLWHKKQETEWDEEKRLILKIPVSDLREIKREILKFGSDVEVLEPVELRAEVKKEIEKMKKNYR